MDGWLQGVGDQHAGHVSEDHTGRNRSEVSGKEDEWGIKKAVQSWQLSSSNRGVAAGYHS